MPFFALLLFLAAADPADDPGAQLARELKKLVDVFVTVDQQAADPVAPDDRVLSGRDSGHAAHARSAFDFFRSRPVRAAEADGEERAARASAPSSACCPGRVIVLQAMPGTPSAKAGLAPGDEILAINGYVLARLEFEQLVQLLTIARQQNGAAGRAQAGQRAHRANSR